MSIFFNKILLQKFFITPSNKIKSNTNKKLSKTQYSYIRKLILYYRFLGLLSFSNKQILHIF